MEKPAIGIDLGATKIAAALLQRDGTVLAVVQAPTLPQRGVLAVIDDLAGLANQLISDASVPLAGIGVGSPGQVDPERGTVANAVNLGWSLVPLASELRSRLGTDLPVWVAKDANLSALGEWYFGAGKGCQDFVYIGVGSGLGGGVVSSGRLITGANGSAAELGHLSLDLHGQRCACGLQGCSETVVSGPGLVHLVTAWLEQGRYPTGLALEQPVTPSAILQAARLQDPLALAALEHAGAWLGQVMAACAAVLNPQRIIIGGGLGLAAFDWLVPPARRTLEASVLSAIANRVEIVPSQVSSPAVGAACLAWYTEEFSRSFIVPGSII